MPDIDYIQRESLGEKVYRRLRDKILSREFKRENKLNINQLSEQLGVSRSPLKEAFNRLALEGLLEIRPHAGTFVKSLTAKEMEDIFEFRLVIEIWAAEQGIKHATLQNIPLMRDIVHDARLLLRKQSEHTFDNTAFLDLDNRFHKIIMQQANNQKMVDVYDSLKAHLQIARFAYARGLARSRLAQQEHERILEAYVQRDARRIKNELKQHIRRNKDDLLNIMEDIGGII